MVEKVYERKLKAKNISQVPRVRQSQAAGIVNWEKCRISTIVWMLSQTESSGFQGSYQDFAYKS